MKNIRDLVCPGCRQKRIMLWCPFWAHLDHLEIKGNPAKPRTYPVSARNQGRIGGGFVQTGEKKLKPEDFGGWVYAECWNCGFSSPGMFKAMAEAEDPQQALYQARREKQRKRAGDNPRTAIRLLMPGENNP